MSTVKVERAEFKCLSSVLWKFQISIFKPFDGNSINRGCNQLLCFHWLIVLLVFYSPHFVWRRSSKSCNPAQKHLLKWTKNIKRWYLKVFQYLRGKIWQNCADSRYLCLWLLMWYLVVVASAEEDAAAGGVPLDQTHPSAVPVQLQHRLHHVAPQAALWDLPYSHLPRSHTQKTKVNTQFLIVRHPHKHDKLASYYGQEKKGL